MYYAVAALALLAAPALYLSACWSSPFTNCRRCTGRGRIVAPRGRVPHRCQRCRGTGRRLRRGRTLINAVHHAREAGNQ